MADANSDSERDQDDANSAEGLLPLVYDELRQLAAARLAQEKPGQTLQATALVHDAFMRLAEQNGPVHWDNRGHFFAAAAEAMRRILIERARRKKTEKHGGGFLRVDVDDVELPADDRADDWLALDEALTNLAAHDPQGAELVKLRLFAGLSVEEAAGVLNMSRAQAYRLWSYARAWLKTKL